MMELLPAKLKASMPTAIPPPTAIVPLLMMVLESPTGRCRLHWLNGWSAAATFEGEFSDVTTSYAGKGVARYTW